MDTKTVTLQIPGPLYERYKQLAEKTHRSVEEEMLEAVSHSAPSEGEAPSNSPAAVNGSSENRLNIPGAYSPTIEEVEKHLASVFTPEQLAEIARTDISNIKLPPGAKSAAEIIREDRDRY